MTLSALGNLFFGGPSAGDFERRQHMAQQRGLQSIQDAGTAAQEGAARQAQNLFYQAGATGPLAARQAALAGAGAQAQAALGQAQMMSGYQNQLRQENQQQATDARTRQADAIGGLINAGTQLGGTLLMSDERAKQGVSDGAQYVDDFLANLDPVQFEYHDGLGPEGQHTGVMAQDVGSSEMGRQMVVEGRDGYQRIDPAQAQGVTLAAIGRIAERLQQLEDGLYRRGI